MAKLSYSFVFSEKKLFPKSRKPLITKKMIKQVPLFIQRKSSRSANIQNMFYVYKKNAKYGKNEFTFFVKNPRRSQ